MEKKNIPAILVKDLNVWYGDVHVIDNVSFQIEEGDYVGILGPNGSGKTTLLNSILGLVEPSSGSIELFGESRERFDQHSWIGYVPQRVQGVDTRFPATVKEVVISGRTAKIGVLRQYNKEDEKAVEKAMEIADVAGLSSRRVGELSGGQRQRVFIARALAAEPRLLILDEPTVGVDVAAQESFYSFIKQLNDEHGITILFVSHDIDVAVQESKTILCLNKELVCHVSSHEFLDKDYLEKMYGKGDRYILHNH